MEQSIYEPKFTPRPMDGFTIREVYAYARKVPPDIEQEKYEVFR